ncbi:MULTISPECIES: thioredoxin family protein [Pseudomonas]|uniref:thioredoxin family protein n=1 Tax=Pseudomonas TaxID=286 RepID=UPI000DA7F30D|nr:MULTISPECIES: thioredoxin family protein [Pseudomonas]MDW3715651.1 thioredoxin family protein [Pseudomonas sp. 2023EL-01195]PZE12882.1 thioredoxin family protein [Pseudomonas sp. 57B-090624]
MASYQQLFEIGQGFADFLRSGLPGERDAANVVVQKLATPGSIGPAALARLQRLERRYHLLVAGEMWCPDCQINVAVLDFICRTQPLVDLAVITKGRAEDDLKARLGLDKVSIPLVVVLDAAFEPVGLFVERPQAVIGAGEAVLRDYKAGQYLEATVEDLLALLEAAENRPL